MLAYAMSVCVLFVSSRSGTVFNPNAGAITDHSQSAKDIDPYFKSQLYVEDPITVTTEQCKMAEVTLVT